MHRRAGSREGGVKIVFDTPDGEVDRVVEAVGGRGFVVRPYYPPGRTPGPPGGAATGFTRLGAEQARRFTRDEDATLLAAFEAVRAEHGLPGTVVGVDVWEAGGDSTAQGSMPAS